MGNPGVGNAEKSFVDSIRIRRLVNGKPMQRIHMMRRAVPKRKGIRERTIV